MENHDEVNEYNDHLYYHCIYVVVMVTFFLFFYQEMVNIFLLIHVLVMEMEILNNFFCLMGSRGEVNEYNDHLYYHYIYAVVEMVIFFFFHQEMVNIFLLIHVLVMEMEILNNFFFLMENHDEVNEYNDHLYYHCIYVVVEMVIFFLFFCQEIVKIFLLIHVLVGMEILILYNVFFVKIHDEVNEYNDHSLYLMIYLY